MIGSRKFLIGENLVIAVGSKLDFCSFYKSRSSCRVPISRFASSSCEASTKCHLQDHVSRNKSRGLRDTTPWFGASSRWISTRSLHILVVIDVCLRDEAFSSRQGSSLGEPNAALHVSYSSLLMGTHGIRSTHSMVSSKHLGRPVHQA